MVWRAKTFHPSPSSMLVDAHTHLNLSPLRDNWQEHLQDFQNA